MLLSRKLHACIPQRWDLAGVLAMEVLFFYTMTQMDYGLYLANYDSGPVIVFKLITTAVPLFFAAISFAALFHAPRLLPGNRFLTTTLYSFITLFLFTNVIHHRYFAMPISLGALPPVGNLPFAAGRYPSNTAA